jgi:hypothetical protein
LVFFVTFKPPRSTAERYWNVVEGWLGLLTLVMPFVLKLTGVITWSWWWVALSPIWMSLALLVLLSPWWGKLAARRDRLEASEAEPGQGLGQTGQAPQVDAGDAVRRNEDHEHVVAMAAAHHGAEPGPVHGELGHLAGRAAPAAGAYHRGHLGPEHLDHQPAYRVPVQNAGFQRLHHPTSLTGPSRRTARS